MILLTKAHLLFMAYDARLAFQDAGVAGGFFPQPRGIGTGTFRAEFLQIREAHHIAGNAYQIVTANVSAKLRASRP
ncbi:Uncharacterised protein [Kluyvera cryocrescens]|uniref:Uncharacterized protein n=1 Tax=Kluyvera cryocrescens TaxID=580 RepID=A0A485BCT8_KLUCR|nr:Uncharacterised protein [Kluyvera cryocrescens]